MPPSLVQAMMVDIGYDEARRLIGHDFSHEWVTSTCG